MACKGEFEGHIILNDTVASSGVLVNLLDCNLSVHGVGDWQSKEKQLVIYPFGKYMLMNQRHEMIASGYEYHFSGTKMGGFFDGSTHPEHTMDCRPIQSIDINVDYMKSGIKVLLSGTTLAGKVSDNSSRFLEPWKFEVFFTINISQIKNFFELSDETYERFSWLIMEYGKNV